MVTFNKENRLGWAISLIIFSVLMSTGMVILTSSGEDIIHKLYGVSHEALGLLLIALGIGLCKFLFDSFTRIKE